ncbi:hypothetical protein MKW92_024834 [Papaver armeniacum]|nr:hypothetical protein MKW92_024834 [Papaver armeniacum]
MTTTSDNKRKRESTLRSIREEPAPVVTDEQRKRTEENQNRLRSEFLSDCVFPETLDPNMSWEEYKAEIKKFRLETQKKREEERKVLMEQEAPLLDNQRREAKKRETIQAREMGTYFKNNPICVFTFAYAKLESPEYKKFIESLNDGNSYKVYFGRRGSLSRIVGLVSEAELNPELKPGDRGYKTKELRPGLHKIGNMLQGYDDVGVLLTDKTKDEVLRKFEEYREYDFVKLGQTPMEPVRKSYSLWCLYSWTNLVFEKDEDLTLPPRSSAMDLCPKLKELGMHVELSGSCIKLTDSFSVCKDGVRVTENAAKILTLLKKKMFTYVLKPLCCWSASTGKVEYIHLEPPKSR